MPVGHRSRSTARRRWGSRRTRPGTNHTPRARHSGRRRARRSDSTVGNSTPGPGSEVSDRAAGGAAVRCTRSGSRTDPAAVRAAPVAVESAGSRRRAAEAHRERRHPRADPDRGPAARSRGCRRSTPCMRRRYSASHRRSPHRHCTSRGIRRRRCGIADPRGTPGPRRTRPRRRTRRSRHCTCRRGNPHRACTAVDAWCTPLDRSAGLAGSLDRSRSRRSGRTARTPRSRRSPVVVAGSCSGRSRNRRPHRRTPDRRRTRARRTACGSGTPHRCCNDRGRSDDRPREIGRARRCSPMGTDHTPVARRRRRRTPARRRSSRRSRTARARTCQRRTPRADRRASRRCIAAPSRSPGLRRWCAARCPAGNRSHRPSRPPNRES